jgi:hypothetical protein
VGKLKTGSSRTVPTMACRGYFLALDESCMALLLAADGDDARVIDTIHELDATNAPATCDVDKAWDGIHRCLTEGKLGSEDGTYPLNAVVLGGLPMHQGDDYIVSFNTAVEVCEVSAALTDLNLEPFLARYWTLDADEYGALIDQEGLDYLTSYLDQVTAFYQCAARTGWATVFVADQ